MPQRDKVVRVRDGEITALHVYDAPEGSVRAFVDETVIRAGHKDAQRRLAERTNGQDDVVPVLRQGHAARTIVDYAKEAGIDCIVIGSHKPGISDYLIGTTASRVVRHAACAVHVLRTDGY